MSVRLLLVEDSHELRRLFARVLKGCGFEVCEAVDGIDALDRLEAFRPEMVVTDLMMPRMDGFELIRRIRAMPTLADVPIVAMTAAVSLEAERTAIEAGAASFLPKPFDGPTLVGRVSGLLAPG